MKMNMCMFPNVEGAEMVGCGMRFILVWFR
jgi:hypothetical protein